MLRSIKNTKSLVLLAAVLAVGSPLRPARGQELPRSYDDAPAARMASADAGRGDLEAARRRLDDIAAARERAQRELDTLKAGVRVPADPAQARAELDRATADRDDLRSQLKSIEQKLSDAQAKADKFHDDALARFEQRDDFKAAAGEFEKARMELKAPTDRVLDQLQQTREFQEAVNAARAAKQAEDKLQADKTTDPKALREAEQAFVAADNKVQELEERALTADADVMAGRKSVDAARDRLRAMRDAFEQDLLKDAAFAALVEDGRQQQSAMDAGQDDLKKLDARIAAAQAVVDGKPADQAMRPDPKALAEAQARLDQINRDYDETRRDIERLDGRARDDRAGDDRGLTVTGDVSVRERDVIGSDPQPIRERVVERVVEEPVYTPVYTTASYDPYYSYDAYYTPAPFFSLSLSYADYCRQPRCYYGYSGYYGGCYRGYWGRYASYYSHSHYYGWGGRDRHYDWGRRDWDHGRRDYGYGRSWDGNRSWDRSYDRGGSRYGSSYGRGSTGRYLDNYARTYSNGGRDLRDPSRAWQDGGRSSSSHSSSSYSSSSSRYDRSAYTGGAYTGLDRSRLNDSRVGTSSRSNSSSSSSSSRDGAASDYNAYRERVARRAAESSAIERSSSSGSRSSSSSGRIDVGSRSSSSSSSGGYRSPTFQQPSFRSSPAPGSSGSSHRSSSSSSERSYRSPTFQQPSFKSSAASERSWSRYTPSSGGSGRGASSFSPSSASPRSSAASSGGGSSRGGGSSSSSSGRSSGGSSHSGGGRGR